MQLRRIHGRLAVIACGLGAAGLMLAAPVRAQEPTQQATTGGRMRILIPNLEHPQGVDDGYGKKVADELRKQIDKLPTHVSVSKDEIKEALRKFKIDEKDLDCIKSRQLAVQMNAELVMCGDYKPAAQGQYALTAQFIGAKTGETFEVPAMNVAANNPLEAATQVFASFEKYVSQLRALAICQQYLGSQQWASALTNCNAALAVNPQSATALYYKATALMSMDSFPASLAALRQVIQINPTYGEALRTAGVVAAKMDSTALSTEYFRQYLELNPGAASVRLSLANDAAKAGNPEGAMKMVEEGLPAAKTAADSADLALYAGLWATQASQKYERADNGKAKADSLAKVAVNYFTRVVTVQDTAADPGVVRNLILLQAGHDQAQQAVQVGAKYTRVRPQDAGIWSAYADALNAAGQTQQAMMALDSTAKYDAKDEYNVAAKRGQWLAEKGQIAGARRSLQEAIQSGKIKADDAAALFLRIGLSDHLSKGDASGAVEYLQAAREMATGADTRGIANYYLGQIAFTRASNMAKAAPQTSTPAAKAARRAAAAQFREAGNYFDAAGAYIATSAAVRRSVEQMTDYIKTYTTAVAKENAK